MESHLDFFLVQNISASSILNFTHGIVGLAPNNKKQPGKLTSFLTYLNTRGIIEKQTVTFSYNITEGKSAQVTLGGNVTGNASNTINFSPQPY